MAVYAISDLHLSFSTNKPMDIFGAHWTGYTEKVRTHWLATVREEDIVLLGGDFSWAMYFEEVKEDMNWLQSLPGKKFMIKGNHDFWWTSLKKMNLALPDIHFIHNCAHIVGEVGIVGSRGWTCPNSKEFTKEDQKIYERELIRLENSIKNALSAGAKKLIAMIHYPPTNEKFEPSGFTAIFEKYQIEHVIYGHLHTKDGFKVGLKGERNGVNYHLTSCDFLDFMPIEIPFEV